MLFFFSPFSDVITSLGEERANHSAFRTFFRFALVWFCLISLPLCVWDGLRLVIAPDKRGIQIIFFLFLYDNICCANPLEAPPF